MSRATRETMRSYHGEPTLKALLVEEIERHRLADQIVQGTYGDGEGAAWRGCAVGCAIHSLNRRLRKNLKTDDHAALSDAAGWPLWVIYLADRIFEGLPPDAAKLWPGQLAEAIPVGADLEPLKHRFLAVVLTEVLGLVRGLEIAVDLKQQIRSAAEGVLLLHARAIATGEWDEAAALAAGLAAGRAAAWAADAAKAAPWAAEGAPWAVGEAAFAAAHQRYADELLRLLREPESAS